MNSVNGLAGKTLSETVITGVTVTATEFTLRAPKFSAVQLLDIKANPNYLTENTSVFTQSPFSSMPPWLNARLKRKDIDGPIIESDGSYTFNIKCTATIGSVYAKPTDWIVINENLSVEVYDDEVFRDKFVVYPEYK